MKALSFESASPADRADARRNLRAAFEQYAALSGARPAEASTLLALDDIAQFDCSDISVLEDRGTGRRALTPDHALSLLLDARAEGMFRAETNLRFVLSGTEYTPRGEREVLRYVLMRDPEPSAFLEVALIARDFLASMGITDLATTLRAHAADLDDDYHAELVAALRRNFASLELTHDPSAIYAPELELHLHGKPLASIGRMDAVATRIAGEACAAVSARIDIAVVLGALEANAPIFAQAPAPAVLVAYYDSGIIEEALAVTMELRAAGIAALFLHGAKNLGKHFRQGERFGVAWIVIVGGREWDKGEVAIRSATSRDEISVPRAEAASALRARMAAS